MSTPNSLLRTSRIFSLSHNIQLLITLQLALLLLWITESLTNLPLITLPFNLFCLPLHLLCWTIDKTLFHSYNGNGAGAQICVVGVRLVMLVCVYMTVSNWWAWRVEERRRREGERFERGGDMESGWCVQEVKKNL
ncbi:MAG: hypothetical protein Q9227_004808 [Pyrenula ochraceoflavens]